MHREFQEKFAELLRTETAFVVATVLAVRGSAAAKPGAKAIINAEGRPVFGWVGGGCVEAFVRAEAAEALREGVPRVVTADLEDEISGVGLPCGGMMDIFIEPILPRRRVLVAGSGALALEVAQLARWAGFAVTLQAPRTFQTKETAGVDRFINAPLESMEINDESLVILADEAEDLSVLRPLLASAKPAYLALAAHSVDCARGLYLLSGDELEEEAFENTVLRAGLDLGGRTDQELALAVVAELLAVTRGASCRPLQEVKQSGPPVSQSIIASSSPTALQPNLVIVGHSSITEELAGLASRLGWPVSVDSASAPAAVYPVPEVRVITFDTDFSRLPVDSESSVVVASHHKGDHLAIEQALRAGARYVGLIASAHRSALVRGMLPDTLAAALVYLRTPAGLDLGATSPAEIALSVMSEVLAVHYGRVGQPRRLL